MIDVRRFFKAWIYRIGIVVAVLTAIFIAGQIKEAIDNRPIPPEGMELVFENTSGKLALGHSAAIQAEFSPAGASSGLSFESSDTNVVTVDESGNVTAKALGSAIITVSTTDGTDLTERLEISTTIPAPENVSVVCAQDDSINAEITWDAVEDAVGYIVYRLAEDGEWVRLTDEPITDTSYTDSDTEPQSDNTYGIKSIAEDEQYNSEIGGNVTLTIPETPYGTKIASITDDGIEYYWKRPAGVEGYEVYRAYEQDGDYTLLEDIDGREVNTYLDADFDHSEKRVYYRIRSYSLDDAGNKVYSEFSESSCASYREKLHMEEDSAYLRSGVEHRLKAYIGWGYADNATWKSSDTSVATVSSDGTVTGISGGECEITCSLKKGKKTMKVSCDLIVDREAPSKLSEVTMDYTQDENGLWSRADAEDTGSAVIMMTGDMMCTGTQQAEQGYNTGDYDFNESYDEVKDILSGADFAIGNLETTLSSTWPYMHEQAYIDNYPNCNAPSRYLDALVYAGFDGVVMANNHNCDAGKAGVFETIEQVERYGLARTGEFSSADDRRYMMVDVNGIKVAYLAYVTTGFNNHESEWEQSDIDTYLNDYQAEKAQADIQAAKDAGAEYVIVYMHWGVKNDQTVQVSQQEDAQQLADFGADYIVGSHCHMLQEYAVLTSADGRRVPCFYSLGDFQASISQVAGNRDSAILRIELSRDEKGDAVLADEAYIPCFTLTEYEGKSYCTIPVDLRQSDGEYVLDSYDKIHERIKKSVGSKLSEYTGD